MIDPFDFQCRRTIAENASSLLTQVFQLVMPGLVPGIHDFLWTASKTWMAGTSPAMTVNAFSVARSLP